MNCDFCNKIGIQANELLIHYNTFKISGMLMSVHICNGCYSKIERWAIEKKNKLEEIRDGRKLLSIDTQVVSSQVIRDLICTVVNCEFT